MPEGVSPEHLPSSSSERMLTPAVLPQPGTLSSEIYAVIGSSISEQRTSTSPAQREAMLNEGGKIIDIAFTQNGERATLKSVLPGSYTIEINRTEKSHPGGTEHFAQNYLTLNEPEEPDTTGETNLILLHEAGHMLDNANNRSTYFPLEKMAWLANPKMDLARVRKYCLTNGDSLVPEEYIQNIRADLELGRNQFTPEEFQEIIQDFERSAVEICANNSLEDLSQLEKDQYKSKMESGAKADVSKERNAWAHALKAMRKLSQQGINIFTGTREELHTLIDGSLGSYEFKYKLLLEGVEGVTPPPLFVKKRV